MGASRLARLVHLSDLHIVDVRSPLRFEWVELLAADPYWRNLLHMHRPYESLAGWALAAHVEAINELSDVDLVISTGDNIDNGQQNELDAYLALVRGRSVALPADGSAQDAGDEQSWPFWCPDPAVADPLKDRGYPAVTNFLERVAEPIRSAGLRFPFVSVMGNHDLMCQGTSLFTPPMHAALALRVKSFVGPPGFRPADPLIEFVEHPERFIGAAGREVAADPGRRPVDRVGWLAAHGYDTADRFIDLEHVRVITLDTNHPSGDYQGSIGNSQLAWLDDTLDTVGAGRVAVVASHHGSRALVNQRGDDHDRRQGDAMLAVLGRYPCVAVWLIGHGHRNHIIRHAGFPEIMTSSTIDWPSEHRVVDISRHHDGTIEVATTMRAPTPQAGSLAALHRDLAERFEGPAAALARYGRPADRVVRLAS